MYVCVYSGGEVGGCTADCSAADVHSYSRPNTIDTVAVMVMSPVGMGVDTNLEAPAV